MCISASNLIDDKNVIFNQVSRYTKEGYPPDNGLSELPVILRRNTEKIKELNELWMYEIEHGSFRDQISFDYCAWKLGIKVNHFDGDIRFGGNRIADRIRWDSE